MKTHCYLLALLCLFFSCTQEELTYSDPDQIDGFTLSSDVFDYLKIENTLEDLSSEEALSVANLFKKRNSDEITRTGFSGEVKDITSIHDKEGNPLMYVVNFTEGFAIVSATKKSIPILAYSEEGSFDSNALAGSSVWLEDTREEIIEMKKDTTLFKESSWMAYEKQSLTPSTIQTRSSGLRGDVYFWRAETIHDIIYTNLYDSYEYEELSSSDETLNGHYFYTLDEVHFDFFDEQRRYLTELAEYNGYNKDVIIIHVKEYSTYTRKEALLNTYWHQKFPYNGKIPNNYPAGCITIAAAQIMNYYRKPSNFLWNEINSYPYDVLQSFILNVGNTMSVTYGEAGSGASADDAQNGFRKYGYSTTLTDRYSYPGIRAELMGNRPVFMLGTKSGSKDGHAWVCDGFSYYGSRKVVTAYFPESIGYNSSAIIDYNPYKPVREFKYGQGDGQYIYYHMNWGYGTSFSGQIKNNGWYLENDVNIENGNFKDKRKYIYLTPPR